MIISIELSYYPLKKDYDTAVSEFLSVLQENSEIEIREGVMSSMIIGEYEPVMHAVQNSLKPFMEKYPSVFHLSISNACVDCKL